MLGVFLACPTYSEEINTGAARAMWLHATQRDDLRIMTSDKSGSLIPGSCNTLWCSCLNEVKTQSIKWFAMLHADCEPEAGWLDKLLFLAEEHGADMLSAVVAIKDDRGVTSTAIASDDPGNCLCRLTMQQLHHPDFPTTFDIGACADALEKLPEPLRIERVPRVGLRLNTGCMVVRMDRPWIGCDPPTVFFDNPYWIEKYNGQWRARDVSEDWRFSEKIQNAGGKLFATKAVKVVHKGLAGFPNSHAWGRLANDAPVATG